MTMTWRIGLKESRDFVANETVYPDIFLPVPFFKLKLRKIFKILNGNKCNKKKKLFFFFNFAFKNF